MWFGVNGLCFRGYVSWVVVAGVLVVVYGVLVVVYGALVVVYGVLVCGMRLTDLNDDIENAGQRTHV